MKNLKYQQAVNRFYQCGETAMNGKERGCRTHQKGNRGYAGKAPVRPGHWQSKNENPCTSLHRQHLLSAQYSRGISQLCRIFEAMQNEAVDYEGDLPISFVSVEREIAKCISGCLSDFPVQKRDISRIQSLLRDYKVVVPVRGQNPTVSLHKVHLILQDNYKGSSLCKLFNMLLGCSDNVNAKVVIF
jgi:hypothetical protein